jgi:hypothetical protein
MTRRTVRAYARPGGDGEGRPADTPWREAMRKTGRPTAKRWASGLAPAGGGGSSRLADQGKRTESVSPPSSQPDRPSPKRLPGGRAFNLGRSVLGALGNLLGHLHQVKHRGERLCRKLRQSRLTRDSSAEFGPKEKCTEVGGPLVRPPNRPPPKRLPVGGPSTSGAPSSVQWGHYGPRHAPSSGNRSRKAQFAFFPYTPYAFAILLACSTEERTMDSPSRVRFRPLPRLTFRFRVRPPGRASS